MHHLEPVMPLAVLWWLDDRRSTNQENGSKRPNKANYAV